MNLVAPVNFAPLGELFNDFTQAQTRARVNDAMRLADLGNPESLLQTGQALARAGDLQTGLSLANLGREMRREAEQRDADRRVTEMLFGGGMGGASAPASRPSGGNDGPLPPSLIQNESGGRWDARNDAMGAGGQRGHFGRAQFGQARLQDAMAAGAIPMGITPEDFMRSPELQRRAEAWHVADINRQIDANGLNRFEGQQIGGVPVTRQGMIAVAHLGGVGGLQRFLASGGQFNPADENGTRLSDYLARHGGGAPVQVAGAMPAGQAPTMGPAMQRLQQLERALLMPGQSQESMARIRALIDIASRQVAAEQQAGAAQIIQREDGVFAVNPRTGDARRIMPGMARAPEGFRVTPNGDLEIIPGGPRDPRVVAQQTQAQQKPPELSAGDRRMIGQAEDELPRLRGTIETLQRAAQLNERAFTGLGAGARSTIGNSGVPLARELAELGGGDARASAEFFSIMNQEAIKAMSETLKGATTDAEMQRFIQDLGNPATPPDVRRRTIDRMLTLAQRQLQLSEDRINQMRGGTYFRPGGGPSQPAPQAQPTPQQPQRTSQEMSPQDAARAELRRRGLIP